MVLLLGNILEAIASGRGVTIIPDNAEFTTVQAADVLNVSQPYDFLAPAMERYGYEMPPAAA